MTSNNVGIIVVIILVFVLIVEIFWIVSINNNINTYLNSENTICPRYYCYKSYCTDTSSGGTGQYVAYRYDSNKNIQCQNYTLPYNVVVPDYSYYGPAGV